MANYRQIHVEIWKDDWFIELPPKEKLLFIYFFSNSNSNLIGFYKISLRVIAFETGLEANFISEVLKKFENDQRVVYRDGVIWVVHMWRYHSNASPKVETRIKNDIALIHESEIKRAYQYYQETGIYPIDIVSVQ